MTTFGEQWGFELGPAERKPITTAALVCLLPLRCLGSGGALASSTTWQPPLFIGCGYGEVQATTVKRCHACGWWIATGTVSVNPKVFA